MKIEVNIANNPKNAQPTVQYVYLDEELFIRKNIIEQTHAWLDSFKALLIVLKPKLNIGSIFTS